MDGEVPGQMGNDHPTMAPMGVFPTADGHVNIAASSPAQFERFCEAAGRPDWPKDERWSSTRRRGENRAALNAAIAEETRKQPSAWWVERLEAAGIPCGPILAVDQVFADPQVKHLRHGRARRSSAARRDPHGRFAAQPGGAGDRRPLGRPARRRRHRRGAVRARLWRRARSRRCVAPGPSERRLPAPRVILRLASAGLGRYEARDHEAIDLRKLLRPPGGARLKPRRPLWPNSNPSRPSSTRISRSGGCSASWSWRSCAPSAPPSAQAKREESARKEAEQQALDAEIAEAMELELRAKQKAARDARYAARKQRRK